MDRAWWRRYADDAEQVFRGERVSSARGIPGVQGLKFHQGGNSGAGAMSLAEWHGARRIILLGYDCGYAADGKRHWHGDHPKGLGNAVSMPKWYAQFEEMAGHLGHCEIINASRHTALELWPRQSLEQALADLRCGADRARRHGDPSPEPHGDTVRV
ncbi:hypothetical protein [Halomonas getboli]|uniref:hypothetical protein n=1 Tax=Halomonas getboli TaxID=2935862 RepID=UPI001FFE2E8D|nr:hypothetical protein [Halomonas getboli]MCK2183512.1 hypothetical protein [Halomonas getboli]